MGFRVLDYFRIRGGLLAILLMAFDYQRRLFGSHIGRLVFVVLLYSDKF